MNNLERIVSMAPGVVETMRFAGTAGKTAKKAAGATVKSDIGSIIKNGKVSLDDLKANPSVFSGKSVDEIAQALTEAGYDVTVKASTKSRSGAQIITVNNPGGGKTFFKYKFHQVVEDMEVVHI